MLQNGVFYAANQLYGLTFKERNDIPVYAPDVRVFEVFDADGSSLALFYCDYFKRDNKQGGAWMSNFVEQSKLLGTKPVVSKRRQFHHACAGRAGADHLRRRQHHVPRIRSCVARHVCQHRRIPVFQAPLRRATSSSFRRSSMSIGPSIRRCSSIMRSTTRPVRRCRRSWWRRSRSPRPSTRVIDLRNCWQRRNWT